MSRKKQKRIKEIVNINEIMEIPSNFTTNKDKVNLKNIFKIDQPITLELACGSGEYCLFLAKKFPNRNYIGIDIKGPRLWQANQKRIKENLNNIIFIRSQIQYINSIFKKKSINQIWIIHPDPQPKKENRRLTNENYLIKYKEILMDNGSVIFRTDNKDLYRYTKKIITNMNYHVIYESQDLLSQPTEILSKYYTETKYGNLAISKKLPIYLIEFKF